MTRSYTSPFIVALLLTMLLALAACGGAEEAPLANQDQPQTAVEPVADEAQVAYPPATTAPPAAEAPDDSYPAQPAPPPAQDPYPADAAADGAGALRTFIVQPGDSSASYLVDEEFLQDALGKLGINAGEVDVVGTTDNVAGQIQFDLDDPQNPLGETAFTADLSLLTTDQDRRDNWLQEDGGGPQFSRFPMASFVATAVEGLPADYQDGQEVTFQMSGDLTVREVTAPVTFDVTAVINGDTLTGTAQTRLLLTDLGIEPPNFVRTLSVANEFGIRAEIVAIEQ